MPITKQRRKAPLKVVTNADRARIQAAYLKKIEEYTAMPLEELQALKEAKKTKGSYLLALNSVLQQKSIPVRELTEEEKQIFPI